MACEQPRPTSTVATGTVSGSTAGRTGTAPRPTMGRAGTLARLPAWAARLPDVPAPQAPAWSWWLAAIIGVGIGVPWLVAAVSGSLAIPHSDGWAYSRIAMQFAHTGEIRLVGWALMTLVGQVVMLGPAGRWLFVQQTAVALLAAVAIYCAYDLLRFHLPRRRALLGAATLAVWPGLTVLATSFMTDVPALAGAFGCLTLGQHALRQDRRWLFVCSLLVGLWAVMVRQQTIAAPLIVIGYAALTGVRRQRLGSRWTLLCGAVFLIAVGVLIGWWLSLPDRQTLSNGQTMSGTAGVTATSLVLAYFTLALMATPALIVGAQPSRWRREAWLAATVVVLIGVEAAIVQGSLLLGNFFTMSGSHPSFTQPHVFAAPISTAVNVVAIVAGALLAGRLCSRPRLGAPMLSGFSALTVLMLLAIVLDGHALFDRYLLTLAPWLLIVAMSPAAGSGRAQRQLPTRVALVLPVVAFAALAILSATTTLNSFASDVAHWHVAQRLVADHVPATRIEDGIWDGWVSPHGVDRNLAEGGELNYSRVEPGLPCYVVEDQPTQKVGFARARELVNPTISGTAAGWKLISTTTYRTFLLFGRTRIYTYATGSTGCRA